MEKSDEYWVGYSDAQQKKEPTLADNADYMEGYKVGKDDKYHGFDYRYD